MSSINNQDKELAEFFTDVEHLRDAFKNAVAAPILTKRLLVIHGVGGVGKSSLLRMFRLHCKSVNVPVALASGDDSKSALDVLTHWTDDLKADSVAFSSFGKTFEHYREIQAKVDIEAQKTRGKLANLAGKAAGKITEAAGGALAGAAIGSAIPGIGTVVGGTLGGVLGGLGGLGVEAMTDWLRGFLTKPDIDLLLDPTKKLTDDFLDDLGKIADKKRIVLMLDTLEQMTALDDWARDVAQSVNGNLLLVIAGRALPNWGRAWSGWMANAQIEELKPMSEDVMRELIRRYYATMRGGEPNPTQVDAIIRFARGLPMVVTSAVQLWVKYGVEDFQSVKAEIVANLVDRLMEGVPSALIPALEAAAIVRWFDQPILRAVTGLADVRDVYNELRRFPFVRTRVEGLALHDAVREIMDENLRAQDSERHCELHERAAAYFEKRLEKVADTRQGTTGEESKRLGLERLYHRVRADEEAGIKLFQEMTEELTRYRLVNRLRALLSDANTYPLERENSKLWREYYGARLAHLEEQVSDAEQVFDAICKNANAEAKLKAYSYGDLGEIVGRRDRLVLGEKSDRAIAILQASLNQGVKIDAKLAWSQWALGDVYRRLDRLDDGMPYYNKAINFSEQQNDIYTSTLLQQRVIQILVNYGRFSSFLECDKLISRQAKLYDSYPRLKMDFREAMAIPSIWMGRYSDTEVEMQDILNTIANSTSTEFWHLEKRMQMYRILCYSTGMQGRISEAKINYAEAIKILNDSNYARAVYHKGVTMGFFGGVLLKNGLFDESQLLIQEALKIKISVGDSIGVPELYHLNNQGEAACGCQEVPS
jgi:tetratricopeptide (TPR) repeat protein